MLKQLIAACNALQSVEALGVSNHDKRVRNVMTSLNLALWERSWLTLGSHQMKMKMKWKSILITRQTLSLFQILNLNVFKQVDSQVCWLCSHCTIWPWSNLLIVYNCPPPKSLLRVQLTGQCRTIPCVFDPAAHSLNTKILIYTFYMCFFEVQMWKPNNQIILLGYHNIL